MISCIICRTPNNEDENYECLHTEYEKNCVKITELSETGLLYEELIGIKVSSEACQQDLKYLCPSCVLQMKLFKKFKTRALKAYNLVKEECNIDRTGINTDGIVEYEQLNENDGAYEYDNNLVDAGQKSQFLLFSDSQIIQNPDQQMNTNIFSTVIHNNQVINNSTNDITLELTDGMGANDIKQFQEIPHYKNYNQNETFIPLSGCEKDNGDEIANDECKEQGAHQVSKSRSLLNDELKCEVCRVDFITVQEMKVHANNVHNGKYPCGQCLKSFKSFHSLRVHLNLHNGTLPYRCDLCPRAFNQKVHYKTHVLQHRNDRNFHCLKCEKAFFTKSDLKIHELAHTHRRPHICEVCGNKFLLLTHLRTHQYVHSNKKMFLCDYCNKSFATPVSLRLHTKEKHMNSPRFQCIYCPKSFQRNYYLKRHITKIHQNQLSDDEEKYEPEQNSIPEFSKFYADSILSSNCNYKNEQNSEQIVQPTNNYGAQLKF